jgi:hypothetical protein
MYRSVISYTGLVAKLSMSDMTHPYGISDQKYLASAPDPKSKINIHCRQSERHLPLKAGAQVDFVAEERMLSTRSARRV